MQHVFSILDAVVGVWLVRVDEGQMVAVRDREFFAFGYVAKGTVDDGLILEIAEPAYVLLQIRVIEHRSKTKDHRLGLALWGRPVVCVVIKRSLLNMLDVLDRVKNKDWTCINDGSCGDVAACKDASSCPLSVSPLDSYKRNKERTFWRIRLHIQMRKTG
jgi:hypothetical protein